MPVKKITASLNGALVGKFKIVGIRLVAGTDAATAIIYDNASAQSGDEVLKLSANAAASVDTESWEQASAPETTNGISITLSGTSPILYLYYV